MISAQPTHAVLKTIHHDKSTLNVGRVGLAMREVVEAMDVEWGLQHVREIQLTVGDMMKCLLDVKGTPPCCLTFPLPTQK